MFVFSVRPETLLLPLEAETHRKQVRPPWACQGKELENKSRGGESCTRAGVWGQRQLLSASCSQAEGWEDGGTQTERASGQGDAALP